MKTFYFIFILSIILMPVRAVSAQELSNNDVEFKSRQFAKDNVGTNVLNVHTFEVDYRDKNRKDRRSYVVVFYINDRPVRQFEQVRLPYTFDWNFNAMQSGHYDIRIDIEDREGNVLSTQETAVDVVRQKNGVIKDQDKGIVK